VNIRIYQINRDRDEKNVAFDGMELLERFQGNTKIDSSIYDKVYDGEADCQSLEGVFGMFNTALPADYRGRSLSVSDVVEIVEAENVKPGFYFCDSIGFKEVPFEPEKTQAQERKKTMTVVLLEPGKEARKAEIDGSLEGMQRVVGGNIEQFCPFEEYVAIICNEEGKIDGLPLNRAIREEDTVLEMSYGEMTDLFTAAERSKKHITGYIVFSQDSFKSPYSEESRTYCVSSDNKAFIPNMGGYSIYGSCLDGTDQCVRLEQYMAAEKGGKDGWKVERCYVREPGKEILDIIAGTCFICDCSGESFASLSDEQINRYIAKYRYPEKFIRLNGEIEAIPFKPNNKDFER
jgi:hypothetical protein